MKTSFLSFTSTSRTIAGLSLILSISGHAIEAPADDAQPPAIEQTTEAAPKQENVAYLGVITGDIPAVLSSHMDIKHGDGIIIRAVMPDGPATDAGLDRHDIVTHIGNDAIASPQEFSATIRNHKPGDTIKLRLIRKGKPVKTEVTLGNRPARVAGIGKQPLDDLKLEGVPPELTDRMRGMIEKNALPNGMPLDEIKPLTANPDIEQAVEEMQKQMREQMSNPGAALPGKPLNLQSGITFRMIDDEGTIEIKSKNGETTATLKDTFGEELWSGPWNTEEDKQAVPEDVRERIKKADDMRGKGFKLKIR